MAPGKKNKEERARPKLIHFHLPIARPRRKLLEIYIYIYVYTSVLLSMYIDMKFSIQAEQK